MSLTHQPRVTVSFLQHLLYRLQPNLLWTLRLFFTRGITTCGSLRSLLLLALVAAGSKPRVLLADDDKDDRDFFSDAVSEVAPDVEIETVTNGERLMQRLLDGRALPDIVFLDLNMPVKDGHECLEEIRANDRLRHLPIVIYSTSASREHIDDAYKHGANLYVRKPDSYVDLKSIAKKLFEIDWSHHTRPAKDKFYFTAKTV